VGTAANETSALRKKKKKKKKKKPGACHVAQALVNTQTSTCRYFFFLFLSYLFVQWESDGEAGENKWR